MLVPTVEVYITDNTGKKFFRTICAAEWVGAEVNNLQRKLVEAKSCRSYYSFIDLDSATIKEEIIK